jgi:hypothetical protein
MVDRFPGPARGSSGSGRDVFRAAAHLALPIALATSLAVSLAACGSGRVVVTAPPSASAGVASPAGSGELGLGRTITVGGPNGTAATVVISKYERLNSCADASPGSGNVFLGVSVSMTGTAGEFPYGPSGWSARAASASAPLGSGCYHDLLGAGTITAGAKAFGWLLFAIPGNSSHAWVDYRDPAGATLEWQLY